MFWHPEWNSKSSKELRLHFGQGLHAVCVVPVVRIILVVHVIPAVPEAEVESLGEGSFSLLSVHNCARCLAF